MYIRQVVYIAAMTKRMVDIDDALLGRARALLNTATIKATVETALRVAVEHKQAMQLAALAGLAAVDWPVDIDTERAEMWT